MRAFLQISGGALSAALLWTTAVAATNSRPIAIDDRVETVRGRAVLIDVLANDSDRDGNLLSVTVVTNNLPTPTALVNHGDGSFTYTPSSDHSFGDFTFQYRIHDGTLDAVATATVFVDRPTEPAPGAAHFTFSCSNLTCDFDGSASSDPVGIVSYGWDLGDGSTASGALVTHSFGAGGTYPVTLTITNTDGGTSSTSSDVTVAQGNQQPVAGDDSLWTPQDTQLNILFGRDLLHNDFDPDGDPLTANIPTVLPKKGRLDVPNNVGGIYTPDPGQWGVDTFQYTVSDGQLPSEAATVTIIIDAPPVAAFTASCTGRTCTFDGSSSSDDLGIVSHSWDFGDGTTGAGATANHTYATSGTYSVSLEVTDTGGQTDSTVRTVQLGGEIFVDGLETSDTSRWSSLSAPSSGLTVLSSARYSGTYGLQVGLNVVPGYVETDTPTGDRRYRARFYVRSDLAGLDVGEQVDLLSALSLIDEVVTRVVLTRTASGLRVFVETAEDAGTVSTGSFALPSGWRAIEIDWRGASSPGANDGSLDVWIDGWQQAGLSGLDSDQLAVETARLGAVASVGALGGILRIDDFASVRTDYIGLKSAFTDVAPTDWFVGFVHALYAAGITAGHGDGTFRPNNVVNRAEMAVFLLRGIHGSGYVPPPASGTVFLDVDGSEWYAPWVEALHAAGIVSGYPNGNFGPLDPVTRAALAVMLLRAKHGRGYTPPPATGTVFTDIDGSEWFAPWVEQLAAEGIVSGYPDGTYRPTVHISRGAVAVTIQRTFNLPLPRF